jgi:hypothetical protein
MLAKQGPCEHQPERRHQEMIGARRGYGEKVEPQEIAADRAEQGEIGKGGDQPPARHDLAKTLEPERERGKRHSRRKVCTALPTSSLPRGGSGGRIGCTGGSPIATAASRAARFTRSVLHDQPVELLHRDIERPSQPPLAQPPMIRA